MKRYFSILFLFVFIACQDEKKAEAEVKIETEEKAAEPMQMYQLSEMAAYMESLYAHHKQLKEKVESGEQIDSLPFQLNKMLMAEMTDPSDLDKNYREMANVFIEFEKQLKADPDNAKQHYQNAIDACISCHQQKCTGPIPRIKKLQLR